VLREQGYAVLRDVPEEGGGGGEEGGEGGDGGEGRGRGSKGWDEREEQGKGGLRDVPILLAWPPNVAGMCLKPPLTPRPIIKPPLTPRIMTINAHHQSRVNPHSLSRAHPSPTRSLSAPIL
jgi:hypothetical protein